MKTSHLISNQCFFTFGYDVSNTWWSM